MRGENLVQGRAQYIANMRKLVLDPDGILRDHRALSGMELSRVV